jgi:cell division protein FtsZ
MSTTTARPLIVGVGNSGVNVLDLLAVECPSMTGLLVVNNDPESLDSSIVREKIKVPEGDAGDGFREIDARFGKSSEGASVVILCGGLGGETGSFLLPALAIHAKSAGIVTMACVGMPFSFEGRHKRNLADRALEKLEGICDAVIRVDNDQLSGGSPSTAAVGDAFALSDRTLLASLLSLTGMLSTSGPVKITRADLHSVLGKPGARTHFGFAKAEGPNRLHEALGKALKSPLLTIPGKGSSLKGSGVILLLLRGAQDISFAEVQSAVSEIERIAGENCQIKVGVHAGGTPGNALEIYLLASSGGDVGKPNNSGGQALKLDTPVPNTLDDAPALEVAGPPEPAGREEMLFSVPSKTVSKPAKKSAISSKQTQGTLALDTVQRGRFDKSEPTIVAGEDLDVPTFLRKGIKLNPPSRK